MAQTATVGEDGLSLSELHEMLQSGNRSNDRNPEFLALVATWDADKELYTITCKEFRDYVGKNQLSADFLVKSLGELRKQVYVTFKLQNGEEYQYHFPAKKTWAGCLNDFRGEAGIPSLSSYQILCDGKLVASSGIPWKSGERYEFDAMQHQNGG
eukprot:TRINITY_DN349_c0_g1_i2.p1 TRINITY_DN349_c0_g1~~TRINITY_DN349_c0_g1_i2.p1  ORF type:complete len:155 (-),score=10.91 TRINITY_DN349_c0_g1_i2:110-574(-)